MQRLFVCERCSRHVRAGERSCPHCGASLPARRKGRGGLGTAVVVTASLVGSACGSGGASDRNDVDRGSGGEVVEPGDVVIDMRNGNRAAIVDAGPPVAPVDAGPPPVEEVDHDIFVRDRPDMPYGAPSARVRLV